MVVTRSPRRGDELSKLAERLRKEAGEAFDVALFDWHHIAACPRNVGRSACGSAAPTRTGASRLR